MITYHWPGNVRELVHAIERAFVMALGEPDALLKHLPEHIRVRMARQAVRGIKHDAQKPCEIGRFKDPRVDQPSGGLSGSISRIFSILREAM